MDKEIKIGYQPSTDNLIKVSKYILRNTSFVKYFLPLIILLLLVSNLLNAMLNDYSFIRDGLIQFGLIILIYGFLYFGIMLSVKKNIVSNKKNTEFQTITFTQKSYLQEGKTYRVENFWNEMYQIKETIS